MCLIRFSWSTIEVNFNVVGSSLAFNIFQVGEQLSTHPCGMSSIQEGNEDAALQWKLPGHDLPPEVQRELSLCLVIAV